MKSVKFLSFSTIYPVIAQSVRSERKQFFSDTKLFGYIIAWILFLVLVCYFISGFFYVSSYWHGNVPQDGVYYFYWAVVWNIFIPVVVGVPFAGFLYFFIRGLLATQKRERKSANILLFLAALLLFVSCSLGNVPFHFRGGTHHDSAELKQQRYHLSYGTTGWCCGDCLTVLTVWECDRFGIMCKGSEIDRGSVFFEYVDCGPNHPPNSEQLPSLAVDPATDELYLEFKEGKVFLNRL